MSERVQRQLSAILAADVAGYSRLIGLDEEGTLARLKELRRTVIDPKIAEHRGRIVKTMGDGLLVQFASAVDAVRCAVDVQSQIAEQSAQADEKQRIQLRIGINVGDVVRDGEDIYGDGVNIAARLEGLAEPGAILVSSSVFEYVRNKIPVAFDDLGAQNLKNIAEPVRIFRIAGTPAVISVDKTRSSIRSIAVLPFTNMSGDPEQQYFSDGVTEDIITELSRFKLLFVIARNSSFQYREKSVDVRRVARELSVRYVVEGSVRKFESRVRITAQLIDALSGNHLWSERYDRNIDELFKVQDELTRGIVAILIGQLEAAEIRDAVHKPTESLSAHDMLLRGIELLRGETANENTRALQLFETAISLDPRFALAHAYLALALLVEHRYDNAPDQIKDRALNSALTAVRLDPRDGRCHQFLGQAYRFRGDFDLAIAHFQRAVTLNPNDANGIALLGSMFGVAGSAEEGIRLIHLAMQLNPFHPAWYWSQLAVALYVAHRYEESLAANRQNSDEKQFWYLARMAACCVQLGRLDEARLHAAEVLRRKPDFRLSAVKLRFKNAVDAEHLFDGLRKAGLPE